MELGRPAHYNPLVCGGEPHYQLHSPRDSGDHYNPLVCGGGPHYQSSAPRDSGAYYNPLVFGGGPGPLGAAADQGEDAAGPTGGGGDHLAWTREANREGCGEWGGSDNAAEFVLASGDY